MLFMYLKLLINSSNIYPLTPKYTLLELLLYFSVSLVVTVFKRSVVEFLFLLLFILIFPAELWVFKTKLEL